MNVLPGKFSVTGATAKFLIIYAYNVNDFQIFGGPTWINSDKYDINAKEDDSVGPNLRKLPWMQEREKVGLMVQSLLADRFKLQVSHMTKRLPVYTLVVARNGSKLTPSAVAPSGSPPKRGYGLRIGRGQLTATGMSLGDLADTLARQPELSGRKVVDRTGLAGAYDITLKYTPDQNLGAKVVEPEVGNLAAKSQTPDSSGPSIFTALQEQLGLKLESTKGPVDVIVIDHIERPSEN
jgi:uncharacterized protein (TIGR03435 family)